jgi:hypothetical protein
MQDLHLKMRNLPGSGPPGREASKEGLVFHF